MQLFEQLVREQPGALSKLVAVAGDCSEPGLGLADGDRALLRERVAFVFHGAASVRFDDPVRKAVQLNTRGAREVVELCAGMARLEVRKITRLFGLVARATATRGQKFPDIYFYFFQAEIFPKFWKQMEIYKNWEKFEEIRGNFCFLCITSHGQFEPKAQSLEPRAQKLELRPSSRCHSGAARRVTR